MIPPPASCDRADNGLTASLPGKGARVGCAFFCHHGSPAQAGIKIDGRNINNLRYADDTTFMAEREEELKSLLMKVKEESEKVLA